MAQLAAPTPNTTRIENLSYEKKAILTLHDAESTSISGKTANNYLRTLRALLISGKLKLISEKNFL